VRGRVSSDESVSRWSRHDWWGVVLEAPSAPELAAFYAQLLEWPIVKSSESEASIAPSGGIAYLAFQTSADYVRPVWPATEGSQQMQMHLDFEVSDLVAAVEHAISLGAVEAQFQPQANVRVLIDPAGHPFCLYVGE